MRYFDGENIRERTIGTFHMKTLTAQALSEFIYEEVSKMGIDWSCCVGQCYDGASVLSGWASGVQARLNEKVKGAPYVHCYAHRLNLVIVDTLKSVPVVVEALSIVQALYNFIVNSNTRHELFLKAQDELNQNRLELERSCPTRWFYWLRAVQKVLQRYEAILVVLEACSNTPSTSAHEAAGYKVKLESFQFIFTLNLLERLLSITQCLSLELQKQKQNIIDASHLISSTGERLLKLREDVCFTEI